MDEGVRVNLLEVDISPISLWVMGIDQLTDLPALFLIEISAEIEGVGGRLEVLDHLVRLHDPVHVLENHEERVLIARVGNYPTNLIQLRVVLKNAVYRLLCLLPFLLLE